jgi:uncharacterized membrane protein YedE/YeeE
VTDFNILRTGRRAKHLDGLDSFRLARKAPPTMSAMITTATSGALFGAALTFAGVSSPNIIIGQLQLRDFHMLKVFLTATSASAIIFFLRRLGQPTSCPPRSPTSIVNGWSAYDANIIGGLMQGFGMALTGACPGTVFVQMALGYPSSYLVAMGGVLGGIAFTGWGHKLKRTSPSPSSSQPATLQQRLGISEVQVVLLSEAVYAAVIAAAFVFDPATLGGGRGAGGGIKAGLRPLLGGLAIGAAQLGSVVLTGNTLGVSTAFEQAGLLFWWLRDRLGAMFVDNRRRQRSGSAPSPSAAEKPMPSLRGVVFALGLMGGAWLISQRLPIARAAVVPQISMARAVLGGFVAAFGARLAGGCTSGHGISGMATHSISSFVTVAAMFGGGIGLSLVL